MTNGVKAQTDDHGWGLVDHIADRSARYGVDSTKLGVDPVEFESLVGQYVTHILNTDFRATLLIYWLLIGLNFIFFYRTKQMRNTKKECII